MPPWTAIEGGFVQAGGSGMWEKSNKAISHLQRVLPSIKIEGVNILVAIEALGLPYFRLADVKVSTVDAPVLIDESGISTYALLARFCESVELVRVVLAPGKGGDGVTQPQPPQGERGAIDAPGVDGSPGSNAPPIVFLNGIHRVLSAGRGGDGAGGSGGGGGAGAQVNSWADTGTLGTGGGGAGGGEGGLGGHPGHSGGVVTALSVFDITGGAELIDVAIELGAPGTGSRGSAGGDGGDPGTPGSRGSTNRSVGHGGLVGYRGGNGGEGGNGTDGFAAEIAGVEPVTRVPPTSYVFSYEPAFSASASAYCTNSLVEVSKGDSLAWEWPASDAVTIFSENATFAAVAYGEIGRYTIGAGTIRLHEFVHIARTSPPLVLVPSGLSEPGGSAGERAAIVNSPIPPSLALFPAPGLSLPVTWRASGTAGCDGLTASGWNLTALPLTSDGYCDIELTVASETCGTLMTRTRVVTSTVDPGQTTTTAVSPISLEVGESWTFTLETFDSAGRPLARGDDVIGVYPTLGPYTGPTAYAVSVASPSLGVFHVSATFTNPGMQSVAITRNGIPLLGVGNPHELNIGSSAVSPGESTASGAGIESPIVGQMMEVVVTSRDLFGNVITVSPGSSVRATMVSESASTPVECGAIGLGLSKCTYNAADPGFYTLNIVINGVPIAGAPFSLALLADCDRGMYAETPYGPCAACSSSEWNDSPRGPCQACPPHTLSVFPAGTMSNCTCASGYWQRAGASAEAGCEACPKGAVCDGGRAQPRAEPGYFPVDAEGGVFASCPQASSSCAGNGQCHKAYTGFLCKDCEGGYYRTADGQCFACPQSSGLMMAGFGCGLVVAGLVGVAMAANAMAKPQDTASHRSSVPHSLSAALVLLQILGLISTLPLSWPGSVERTMSPGNVANLDMSIFATGCSITSFSSRYLLSLAVPAVVFAAAVLGACMFGLAQRCGLIAAGSELARVKPRSMVERLVVTVAPLLYIPLSKSALALFDCSRFPNGKYFLDAEPSFECFSDRWFVLLPFGLAALGLFVIGVPASFTYLLFSVSDTLREPDTMRRFSPLYVLMRTPYPWMECVLLAKRLAIVAAALFFSNLAEWLISSLIFIFFFFYVLQARWQPYWLPLYNTLEERVGWGCIALVTCGAMFHSDTFSSPASRTVFTIVAFVVIGGLGVVIVSTMWIEVKDIYSRSRAKGPDDVREEELFRHFELHAPDLEDRELARELDAVREAYYERRESKAFVEASRPLTRQLSLQLSLDIARDLPVELELGEFSPIAAGVLGEDNEAGIEYGRGWVEAEAEGASDAFDDLAPSGSVTRNPIFGESMSSNLSSSS
ncbi:uncharacterized protein AMSG_08151 [Thecamonas trahens ATCC 50062]|uniref:DUF7630 domain-containing protein n=1 Tax=Thecamonas trahens ATCC 50062 TaxID=461836 RepID=A0A0L0DI48_THETB|nr:hypothetical protein AMSG_08151 [Thecamonas trahens ATCC 50062]KNC51915.1 hypothetical protein AMSG_08151 [Thecamonas trahens ATCC 50062]|eukprot:XP_013755512.1 hypothetical protein AMSG_08151 [Thecamonas trahens ATCC 50062]